MKNFKYKAIFASEIFVVPEKDTFLAQASLEELRSIIPASIKLDENYDLFPVAFNAAVVNRINKNDDGVMTDVGLAIAEKFIHKLIDVEHKREKVIGHLVNSSFSKFSQPNTYSSIITPEKDTKDPFNISLAGVLYAILDTDLMDLIIESCDPDSNKHLSVSASWELLFDDYIIGLGTSKNIKDLELVTDAEKIKEYSTKLRAYGGSGKLEDGRSVYRIIVGEVLPVGIGLTRTPAAEVQGMVTASVQKKVTCTSCSKEFDYANGPETSMGAVKCPHCSATINQEGTILEQKEEKSEKNDATSSQTQKKGVNNIEMKTIKTITELKSLKQEELPEVAVASLFDVVEQGIKDSAKQYQDEIAAKEKEAKEAKDALAALQKQSEDNKAALDKLVKEKAEQEAQAAFDARMTGLNTEFKLDEELSQTVAGEIKGLTDEAFAAWKKKFDVLAKAYKKGKESTASTVEKTPEQILAEAKANAALPPNTTVKDEGMAKYAKAFEGDGLIVK
jgi:DNA-directed RNA polymerase subunit RPC12/RpoP